MTVFGDRCPSGLESTRIIGCSKDNGICNCAYILKTEVRKDGFMTRDYERIVRWIVATNQLPALTADPSWYDTAPET